MKPPISYYGGKGRLAPWICQMFPPHTVYVEAFAGSAAVLFAKTPVAHEVINDLDGELVNFMRVLRSRPDDLETACRLTPYARAEYEAACADDPDADELERARRWWVRSTGAFNGGAKEGTSWSISVGQNVNRSTGTWNKIARFAPCAQRLSTVAIESRPAIEVIERYAKAGAVVYCDPPYLGSTRSSFAEGKRPAGDYRHEMHTDDDHQALADVLRASPATVLLSGYHSPLYDALYEGWWRTERTVERSAGNGLSAVRGRATEVVWCNRPITSQHALDLQEATP